MVKRQSAILAITENGYGKRTSVDDYRVTNRGGKGIINIKCSDRNGKVVAVKEVLDDDELIMMTKRGMANRMSVNSVRIIGRSTQGVRLINLRSDDKLTSVAVVFGSRKKLTNGNGNGNGNKNNNSENGNKQELEV